MTKRNILVAALAVCLSAPFSGQVFAQGIAVEEIVVTARKRDENIYEVPISVTAVSSTVLERAGIKTPDDLTALVPGLDFRGTTATGGRVNPAIRFRGMNQQIITPSTQVGALFWEGSYIGAGGAVLPLGDLERVEVIKGPQTAYFGRNTFTGAVNYIPKTPGDTWEGDMSLDWSPSQNDEYSVEVGVGGPVSDKVGLRLWGGYDQDGGDFDTDDGEAYNVMKVSSVMGTLTYDSQTNLRMKLNGYYVKATDNGTSAAVDSNLFGTPAGACNLTYTGQYLNSATGERTPFTRDLSTVGRATFCGQYPNGEGLEFPTTVRPVAGQSFLGDSRLEMMSVVHPLVAKYDLVNPCPGRLCGNTESYRVQFNTEYDVADHTVSLLASRAGTGSNDVRDFFFGVQTVPGQVFIVGINIYSRETFYEARITSDQDQSLRYMIGVSDYTLRYRQARAPTGTQLVPGRYPDVDFQDSTTTAVFAALDYDISDALTLSLEARYTDEESNAILQGSPNRACGASPVCGQINEYDDFIPRVILTYRPYDNTTTYASYSYSSLLGVATQAAFINTVAPEIIPADAVESIGLFTKPQENEQFEIGIKQVTDNWAYTFALFYADWKNQPLAAVILLPTGGTTAFRNSGNSEYKGFDFEVTGSPTDWLNLTATLAYTDTKMTQFSSRGSNEFIVLGSGPLSVVNDGNKARNIPAWTASLSPTILGAYGDRDWYLRADVSYHSKSWADYSQFNRMPDRMRINARAGIDLTDLTSVELWAKNLTNNKTLELSGGTTSGPAGGRKAFNQPYQRREFGIKLIAQF